jgi:hypothetical protein
MLFDAKSAKIIISYKSFFVFEKGVLLVAKAIFFSACISPPISYNNGSPVRQKVLRLSLKNQIFSMVIAVLSLV